MEQQNMVDTLDNELKTLKTELTNLKTSAAEQSEHYQSSKDLLYLTLVDSYLWWRQATEQNGYLDSLYEEAKIKASRGSGGGV